MKLAISIAAAVTIAVALRTVQLLFLSGKTITEASLFGRFVARTEMARRDFVAGWRAQNWRYLLVAYPCILVGAGLVSLLLYWMLPPLDKFDSLGDAARYCVLLFGVGVSASVLTTFCLIFLVFFSRSAFAAWWRGKDAGKAPPPSAPDAEETK